MRFIKNLLNDESGATAIEYGLIAALVSVAAIAALRSMGTSLTEIFSVVSSELEDAASSAGTSS
jgi:pilus assembly protein Flp/PilA